MVVKGDERCDEIQENREDVRQLADDVHNDHVDAVALRGEPFTPAADRVCGNGKVVGLFLRQFDPCFRLGYFLFGFRFVAVEFGEFTLVLFFGLLDASLAFDELFGSVYGRTTCLRGHLAKLRLLVGYEVGGLCKIVGVVLVFLRSLFKLVHAILILLKTVVVFFQPLIVFLHGRVVLAQHRLVPLLELFVYRSRGAEPFHLVQHGCGLVEHGFGEFKLGASVIELRFGVGKLVP